MQLQEQNLDSVRTKHAADRDAFIDQMMPLLEDLYARRMAASGRGASEASAAASASGANATTSSPATSKGKSARTSAGSQGSNKLDKVSSEGQMLVNPALLGAAEVRTRERLRERERK